jgi:cytochrome c556
MTLRVALSAAVAAGLMASCATGAPDKGGLSIKAQMKQVVEPASNTLFGVGGDVDPANGPGQPPVPAARWKEAADAARSLNAVALSLTEKGRGKDEAEWKAFSRQMAQLSAAGMKAAAAKDGAGLSKAANDLSDNCAACHTKYKPKI